MFWILMITINRMKMLNRNGMKPNGPAIWGGCVPPAGGWRTFCRPGTKSTQALRVSWYTVDKWPKNCLGCRNLVNEHWRSVAMQFVSEPENCQGILNLNWEQMRVSGYNNHYKIVLGAGAKVEDTPAGGDEIPPWRGKKCDKQLTHIVRVIVSCYLIFLFKF
jgi:hypothetical protein